MIPLLDCSHVVICTPIQTNVIDTFTNIFIHTSILTSVIYACISVVMHKYIQASVTETLHMILFGNLFYTLKLYPYHIFIYWFNKISSFAPFYPSFKTASYFAYLRDFFNTNFSIPTFQAYFISALTPPFITTHNVCI